jgi:hypothetical protein
MSYNSRAMFHSTLLLQEEAIGFIFHGLRMYITPAMERDDFFVFSPYRYKGL